MSKIAISGASTGTATFTLESPATSTNRTITLADATGTMVVSGTTPSLNGITFPATQVASAGANTLDDYEEGTWTPGISFGGASAGVTFNSTTGNYVKIGQLLFVNFRVDMSSKGSSTGAARITGVPFILNGTNTLGAMAGISLSDTDNLTFTANLIGGAVSNASELYLGRLVSGSTAVIFTNTEFANNTVLRGSVVTITA
jgi:hypothetical protein